MSVLLINFLNFKFDVSNVCLQILEEKNCWKYNSQGQLNWTLIYNNTENSCVFIFLQQLFPNAVYSWTVCHILSDVLLCVGSIHRSV